MQGGAEIQGEPQGGRSFLRVFADPLAVRIIRALEDGPLRLADLHEQTGRPSQTTLRATLLCLREIHLLERVEVSPVPLGIANALTGFGREALVVLDTFERWLAKSPQAPPSGAREVDNP